ncbi:MAG TPA: hypothetical protein VFI68_04095 [Anaerolineales bacterium]|nr:hypothetical protein [Anaerolineales bacterium]
MGYEKIGDINGRWKAEIIETFLESKGVEVELVQEAITHYLYRGPYDLVQIFVPGREVVKARELLKSFDEFQLKEDGDDKE